MQYIGIQKNVTSSPRKLRLVADLVRNMNPAQALTLLKFTNKAAAVPLSKAIKTVLANAGNREDLSFQKIEINEGPKLKRFRAGSRGHADPYKKRWSHIKIVLTDETRVKGQGKTNNGVIARSQSEEAISESEVVDKVLNEPRIDEVVETEIIEEPKVVKKKGAK